MSDGQIEDKPERGPSIARTAGYVGILTFASKIIGFIRDLIVASAYGTGIVSDAYQYAYMLTGNVLILFGGLGGPFHSSTVTVLTPKKNDPESGVLVCRMLLLTVAILTAITAIIYVAAPYLVQVLTHLYLKEKPNSDGVLFASQTLEQLRIMLPLVVIAGIVGISYGVLNVYNKVFWPSMSPAIASIAIILAILCSDPNTRLITAVPLAVGTLIGAVGQMFAQFPSMSKLNLKYQLKSREPLSVKNYFSMLWPATFSTSVGQLTVYVDAAFAASIATSGAWTAIINSNRLVQLPLGILLTAMLVPILPRFTEQVDGGRVDDLKDELRRALRILWFIALPLTAILIAIPGPIIQVLFKRGNFNAESVSMVSEALLWLAPSIFFYVARDLLTRVFYAYQDSKTPYYVAIVAILVKTGLDWLFVAHMQLGVAGISLASTLITVLNMSLLLHFLRKKVGLLGFGALIQPLLIMILASAACGATAYWVFRGTEHLLDPIGLPILWTGLISLSASGATALTVYILVALTCKLDEPRAVGKRLPVVKKYIR